MTGSSPKLPSGSPRRIERQRTKKPDIPLKQIGALFAVYVLVGLLLSLPAPPIWIWVPTIVGTVLLIWGLNRPMAVAGQADRVGLLSYMGALLLVMAMAIATNYIGAGQGFDDVRFFVAIFGLAVLTLLAVAVTAAAAITSAQAGALLMRTMDYNRSLIVLMSTCFFGTFLGALVGFVTTMLGASAS